MVRLVGCMFITVLMGVSSTNVASLYRLKVFDYRLNGCYLGFDSPGRYLPLHERCGGYFYAPNGAPHL